MRTSPTPCVSTFIATLILLNAASVALAQPCQPHWNTAAPLVGDPGLNSPVRSMTVFDDGTGSALYAGGFFSTAGGVSAGGVAKWDGSSWSPLGNGLFVGDWIRPLAVFDDGTGPALYAGGLFTSIGGTPFNSIAKWDGSTWSKLGSGLHMPPNIPATALSLAVFDDGSGPALYVGGNFESAGGLVANSIAKWDGSTWSTLDSGVNSNVSGFVTALEVFDDGTGPALYVGGLFSEAGGAPISSIAKWDGSSFRPVGGGMTSVLQAVPVVYALDVFDDGSGPALYAAGLFTAAGGVEASSIAKWDGSSWSPLGNVASNRIFALSVFDDGSGPALYAGGTRITAGATVDNPLARWDGASWSALGTGVSGSKLPAVEALTVFDDGSGPSLFAGGFFLSAGGATSYYIAEWVGCADIVLGDVNGDRLVDGADLSSLLTGWGACPPPAVCAADLNSDGVVNAADLATLLANWSP